MLRLQKRELDLEIDANEQVLKDMHLGHKLKVHQNIQIVLND